MFRLPRFDNVTKVLLIYFCTRFHLYIYAYGLILQSRGLSLVQISTIESVVIGTTFLADVPSGILADRLGRKWSIFLSALCLMCGELIFMVSRTYPQYLLLAILTGLGFAFGSGATESLLYDSLPPENRPETMKRIMGRYGSIGQIAFFLSPIVGALIVGDLAPDRVRLAIGLTATALGLGALISLTLREPVRERLIRPSMLTILRGGLSELRRSPALRTLVLLTVLTAPFGGPLITTLAPPYLVQNGVPTVWIGLALSIGSLIAAVAQGNAYRLEKRLGERKTLLLVTLLPGALYVALALVGGPLPVWLVLTFMYGVNDMKMPLFSGYQNSLIAEGSRATVLSMINMLLNLFIAVMAPLYAAIATHSLSLAFVALGGVILVSGLVLVPRLKLGSGR